LTLLFILQSEAQTESRTKHTIHIDDEFDNKHLGNRNICHNNNEYQYALLNLLDLVLQFAVI